MSTAQLILGNDPAFQFASALEAIRKAEQDFAGLKADHKARMEALYAEVDKLRTSILTGQKQLPLEPIAEEPQPLEITSEFAQKVQDEMHAAGFTDCTVTAGSDIPAVLDAENEDTKVGL
jgi:hypothetical protein